MAFEEVNLRKLKKKRNQDGSKHAGKPQNSPNRPSTGGAALGSFSSKGNILFV